MVGSPPHRRGKAGENHLVAQLPGITPAWAGKSGVPCCSIRPWWDHPRVGGEKPVKIILWHSCQGSPPHGRGKVVFRVVVFALGGITPAWAGKSSGQHNASLVNKDHPRVGGEKCCTIGMTGCVPGSPPRGRGKARWLCEKNGIPGITPAWAGKRLKRSHRSGIFISGPIPFHSVLHRPAGSGGSRAGRDGSPVGQPQNAGPA